MLSSPCCKKKSAEILRNIFVCVFLPSKLHRIYVFFVYMMSVLFYILCVRVMHFTFIYSCNFIINKYFVSCVRMQRLGVYVYVNCDCVQWHSTCRCGCCKRWIISFRPFFFLNSQRWWRQICRNTQRWECKLFLWIAFIPLIICGSLDWCVLIKLYSSTCSD